MDIAFNGTTVIFLPIEEGWWSEWFDPHPHEQSVTKISTNEKVLNKCFQPIKYDFWE